MTVQYLTRYTSYVTLLFLLSSSIQHTLNHNQVLAFSSQPALSIRNTNTNTNTNTNYHQLPSSSARASASINRNIRTYLEMNTGSITNTSSQIIMDKAKSLIAKAISIGAPAYNAGDIPECARVYKETAMEITTLGMLPPSLQNGLQDTLDTEHDDPNEAAWAFRKQFDSIVEYQIPFMPQTYSTNTSSDDSDNDKPNVTLEKFTDKMIPSQPVIVNDNVMGGMSQGQWVNESKIFRGTTSLANNGGFASLRWRMNTIQNWSYAKGMYLKVNHSNPDVHTFRLILKDTTCGQVRGANYKNVFSNPNSKSNSDSNLAENAIFIPFDKFDQIEQMGRALVGPTFNRGAVTEIGLMAIKPTVVGEFELQIEEWGLYF